MSRRIENIQLDLDPCAGLFEKKERVTVLFASEAGVIASREGMNRYQPGDALVTGSTGDQWVVSRGRFDERYLPVVSALGGKEGEYENVPRPVFAKQIDEPFAIARSAGGDWIEGDAMDWLIQYAPGDFGIVQNEKFQLVYRALPVQAASAQSGGPLSP